MAYSMPPADDAPSRSRAPPRVGRYELLVRIAQGGMGVVYLARARGAGGFERLVALKLTHAHLREEAHWSRELIEEAKLAAGIRHPNVVPVLDVDDDPEGTYLVMEYVEGDSLSGLLRHAGQGDGWSIPIPIALRILSDALEGLHAAHELRDAKGALVGLVHRDFSPHNVLVGTDGISRLTDFGVAKAATRVASTKSGAIKGKVGYMSPEQVRGRPLDRRSDVWAAGVVAWELFAGRKLYTQPDSTAVLMEIVLGAPPRLRSVRSDLPEALDDVVAGALTPEVSLRCSDVDTFRSRLLATAGVVPAAREEVASYVKVAAGDRIAELRTRAHSEYERLSAPPPELATTQPAAPPVTGVTTAVEIPSRPERDADGPRPAVDARPARRRSRTIITVVSGAALAGLAAMAIVSARSGGDAPRAASPASSAEPAAITAAPLATTSTAPLESATATASPSASIAAPPARAPAAVARPGAVRPADARSVAAPGATPGAAPSAAVSAPPTRTALPLAGNPYDSSAAAP